MRNQNYLESGEFWAKDQHDLESMEDNDLDLDEGNQTVCRACMVPIFSTPYHKDGDHFFHNCCARLPKFLGNNPLHMKPPLELHDQILDDYSDIICNNCRKECKGFFYQCPDDGCRFTLDIKCAITVNIVHRSHKHKLAIIPTSGNSFTCGACGGDEKNGEFYGCHSCRFYLHPDCASRPNTILYKKHDLVDGQQHPLTLVFDPPKDSFKFRNHTCSLCAKALSSINSGVYFCTRCNYGAHVKCLRSEPQSDIHPVSSKETASGLPHLPMKDEQTSLISYLDKKECIVNRSGGDEKKKLEDIHAHKLNLVQENDNYKMNNESGDVTNVCNACIEPISTYGSTPFYTCSLSQCRDHYYLHKSCASLPEKLQHPLHSMQGADHSNDHPLTLHPTLSPGQHVFMFRCTACKYLCNGFVYICDICDFKLDLKCAFLPDLVTYELHGKSHILFLSRNQDDYYYACNCCGDLLLNRIYYGCSSCPYFKIHDQCALLPSRVSHKYDRHRLKLTPYDESLVVKDGDQDFCEICETNFMVIPNRKSWFYCCKECVTLFHINCVPCVGGQYFQTKFGMSIRLRCHDCPLTSIRLINSYSYSCSLCVHLIVGKDDLATAFECTKCGYWSHYLCAEKKAKEEATMMQEKTFIMIKPNGVRRGLVSVIISQFEKKGFTLKGLKLKAVDRALAESHYADFSTKPFFNELVNNIVSGPVVAMVWEGMNVVNTTKKMIEATNLAESAPGTISDDYAAIDDIRKNVIHGSDEVKSAKKEIEHWFPEGIVEWRSSLLPWIYE